MNNTSVSPIARPNLCMCGHPLLVHTFGTPGSCAMCIPSASGVANQHTFASDSEYIPPPGSVLNAGDRPRNGVNAGGVGVRGSVSSGTGNALGATAVLFGGFFPEFMKIGGTFMTVPTNIGNSYTYRIIAVQVSPPVLTIPAPGLRQATNNVTCIFFGYGGSGMGPGRPPNGQRAG